MLAPNPHLRREPWETPADIAPALIQGYGHRVALDMAIVEIRRHMDAAAHIFANRPRPVVWCGEVPFPSYAEAARFAIAIGACKVSERVAWVMIKRTAPKGGVRYGLRWKCDPSQPDGYRGKGRPGKAVMRVADGRRYFQVIDAAKEWATATGISERAAWNRIYRAVRTGAQEFGSQWRAA